MPPTRIIIDTDPGVDDALAILLALASPEIQLEALTTTQGNVTLERARHNARSILELANASHIPAAEGSMFPLVQSLLASGAVHGASGIGNAKLPEPRMPRVLGHAVDYLIERVLAEPNEISIFAIGPLTNIAMGIRKEPEFAKAVKELVIMDGAIQEGGNMTPLAELNIFVDPHAAHIVYHSGMPLTRVPLDVTCRCILRPGDVERLQKHPSPVSSFIDDATRFYMEFHDEYQQIGGAIHDPLALALTVAPELCDYQELFVDVDISGGVSMGETFADFCPVTKKRPNMKVARGVRARDFLELFLEGMERLAHAQKLQSNRTNPARV